MNTTESNQRLQRAAVSDGPKRRLPYLGSVGRHTYDHRGRTLLPDSYYVVSSWAGREDEITAGPFDDETEVEEAIALEERIDTLMARHDVQSDERFFARHGLRDGWHRRGPVMFDATYMHWYRAGIEQRQAEPEWAPCVECGREVFGATSLDTMCPACAQLQAESGAE